MLVLDRFDPEKVAALHERGEFFWLDLEAPSEEEVDALSRVLDLPPLAVEDTMEFGQRAKVDDYGERLLIVFFAAAGDPSEPRLIELHVHLSGREMVTVHREPCPPLEAAKRRPSHGEHAIVYRVLDACTESTVTLLHKIEEVVEGLEQRAFERPSDTDRRRITKLRGQLFRVLQIVVPERDMLDEGAGAIERVLGMDEGELRHPVYDVRDDLVLAAQLVVYCRELLGEALTIHLQATSNRLNEIATRLTLLATFFVPLTLITGYFGMNFGWLTENIDDLASFLVWGVGAMLATVVVIYAALRRAGYLTGDGQ